MFELQWISHVNFFYFREAWGFFSEKKKKTLLYFLIFKRETWDSFSWFYQTFKCDRTCAMGRKYTHTHAPSHAQFQEASHPFRTWTTASSCTIATLHARTLTLCFFYCFESNRHGIKTRYIEKYCISFLFYIPS